VHDAVGRRVDVQAIAKGDRRGQAMPPEAFPRRLIANRDHSQRNLRSRTIERISETPIASAEHHNQIAGRRA
jgi:hypothetical protein